MHRRTILPLLVAAVALGACSKKQAPVEQPRPAVNQDSIDAARLAAEKAQQDSIRAAEEARRRAAEEADRAARAALSEMIFFDYDQFAIQSSAEEILLRKAAVLKANPDVRVTITGHADERGSVEYNLTLGMRRAESAKAFLVNYGIDAGRLEISSLGEQQPLEAAQSEEAFAKNRRDEFTVTTGSPLLQVPGSGL